VVLGYLAVPRLRCGERGIRSARAAKEILPMRIVSRMHEIAVLIGSKMISPLLRIRGKVGGPLQGRNADIVPLLILEIECDLGLVLKNVGACNRRDHNGLS